MALLPIFQTSDKDLQLLQNKWASILNPVISSPVTNPGLLKSVKLISGVNVINHLLQVTQQGWIVTDVDASSSIFRSAPFNSLTLTLTSSAACVVDLLVY